MALWEPAGLPVGFTEVWHQDLRSLAELAGLRTRLRSSVTGSPTPADPAGEHWSELLVLAVDELASNALRHGRAPVSAALSRDGEEWLIAVTDADPAIPPTPARGRDPGLGGFGLYLVADLSRQHGWTASPWAKTVWAVVAADPAGAPAV